MQFVRDKRIRFQHCDAAGIVFNPQYLVLCNELIEDWFTEGLGVDYACLHRDARLGTPMIRVEADFLRASGLGDTLAFHLTVERVGAASLHLSIEARAADEPRFRARLKLALMSLDTMRAVPIDETWRARFTDYLGGPETKAESMPSVHDRETAPADGSNPSDRPSC